MTSGPRVAIGMTLHNNARFLSEAADSILCQTYPHFTILMLDDGSSDETETIARSYAARDVRARYVRHGERQGMIQAWRRAFEIACVEGPPAEYFAWASDHDRWHPDWLRALVECLDHHCDAVLAYPLSRRIDVAGSVIEKPLRTFETAGVADLRNRWARVCHEGVGAGDMVYGLMRARDVAAAGIFRDVLRPDRLLIAELALRGQFLQVPEILWFRRQIDTPSVDRQSQTLFRGHPAPRSIALPPPVQHARALYANYVRRDSALGVSRAAMTGMIARYAVSYSVRHFRKSALRYRLGVIVDGLYLIKKVIKRAYHHSVYSAAMFTRRIGLRH